MSQQPRSRRNSLWTWLSELRDEVLFGAASNTVWAILVRLVAPILLLAASLLSMLALIPRATWAQLGHTVAILAGIGAIFVLTACAMVISWLVTELLGLRDKSSRLMSLLRKERHRHRATEATLREKALATGTPPATAVPGTNVPNGAPSNGHAHNGLIQIGQANETPATEHGRANESGCPVAVWRKLVGAANHTRIESPDVQDAFEAARKQVAAGKDGDVIIETYIVHRAKSELHGADLVKAEKWSIAGRRFSIRGRAKREEKGFAGAVALAGKTQLVKDRHKQGPSKRRAMFRFRHFQDDHSQTYGHYCSYLGVPVFSIADPGEVIAVICFAARHCEAFTKTDTLVVESLARVLSSALTNVYERRNLETSN